MIEQTTSSLFMYPPLAKGFYQEIFKEVLGFDWLAKRLIHSAETAHAFRQYDQLKEAGLILMNFPVKNYSIIGQYYLALSMSRNGFTDIDTAKRLFEIVASQGPIPYKSKALLMLSNIAAIKQDYHSAFGLYAETIKTRHDLSGVKALRGIAILKAYEGYHKSALKDLENLYPMMRLAPPQVYFSYLNSLAVELSEAGRLQEAKSVSSSAISSPFGIWYPEWKETYSEVNQKLHKSRSTVAVSTPKSKPIPEHKPKPVKEPNIANIIKFPKTKVSRYDGIEIPALTPIQWLAVMLKIKFGEFIPNADSEIDRFCDAYLDLVINFYD